MEKALTYMSSPTYEKLVDAISVYIDRYDEDTLRMIPFFINAAEKYILRSIRMPSMEKMVSFTLEEAGDNDGPVGNKDPNEWILVPSDYIEMRYVWSKGETLQRVTFDQLLAYGSNDNPYGCTWMSRSVWAINGGRVYTKGVGQEDQVMMTYYAEFPEIGPEVVTNPLLELLPDAFLYLAVSEGFRFVREEERSTYWEQQAQMRISSVQAQVKQAEFSGSPLVISPTSTGFTTSNPIFKPSPRW